VYGKKNGNARVGVVAGKETKQGKIKWLGQVDLRKQKKKGVVGVRIKRQQQK